MGLGFLSGISPWWWVALAVLLAAAEMLTVSTVLVWPAAAAVATAALLWLVPGMGGAVQVIVFAGLSIALTFAGRAVFAGRLGREPPPGTLNRRAAQLVGREARVIRFDAHGGLVEIDGVPWQARLAAPGPPPEADSYVRITAAEGSTLAVAPS